MAIRRAPGAEGAANALQTTLGAQFDVAGNGDFIVLHVPDDAVHRNLSGIINWQRLLDSPAADGSRTH